MSAQKFFRFAFALNGDRAVIPDEAQSDGSISYNQGFGPDYERDPVSDPLAKRVPRDETNQYLYDLSDNVRQYQLTGSPEWVTAAQNGGSPVSYAYAAQVRYDAGAGVKLWISTVANNTTTPGADTSWALFEPFNFAVNVASNAEVQAGVSNVKIVTPLNLTARTATTTRTGIAALATLAEVIAGTDATKIVTPATLAGLTASETVAGLSAFATTAEVQAGVSASKSITPAGLVQRIATVARAGIAALASQAEVIAGTEASKIVTPATLQGKTATTGRIGFAQLATNAEAIAGTNVDKIVTPAALLVQSFGGPDYTWQNLNASRAPNTSYRNTFTRPIEVSINSGGSQAFLVSVNNVDFILVTSCEGPGNPISVTVPPGMYYRLNGDNSFRNWSEMRPNT